MRIRQTSRIKRQFVVVCWLFETWKLCHIQCYFLVVKSTLSIVVYIDSIPQVLSNSHMDYFITVIGITLIRWLAHSWTTSYSYYDGSASASSWTDCLQNCNVYIVFDKGHCQYIFHWQYRKCCLCNSLWEFGQIEKKIQKNSIRSEIKFKANYIKMNQRP